MAMTHDATGTDGRIAALEARIGGLETHVAWLRRAAVSAAVVAVAAVALAAKPAAPVVEGSQFVLRDDAGNARAKWYVGQGSPRLAFADTKGRARLLVALEQDTPMVSLANDAGVVQMQLSLERFGPAIYLRDAAGAVRSSQTVVAADAEAHQGPRLEFYDAAGRGVLGLRASGAGDVSVGVGAEGGRNGAVMTSRPEGARFHLTDRDGKVVFERP